MKSARFSPFEVFDDYFGDVFINSEAHPIGSSRNQLKVFRGKLYFHPY